MEHHIELRHGMENVFGIEGADDCRCKISISTTDIGAFGSISIYQPQPLTDKFSFLYVVLTKVPYFEGNVYWTGANFQTASEEECRQFLAEHDLMAKYSFSPEPFLFTVQTSHTSIRFVAHKASVYPDVQTYFQGKDNHLLDRISTRFSGDGKPVVGIHRTINTLKNGKEISGSVRVEEILQLLEEGNSFQDILAFIHWLEPEDIQACLVYARQAVEKN